MQKHWTEKYWEYMVKANFEEAIPLKLLNFPKSFFKYRNLSERTIETLDQNYIWLAEISTLNDPFECSIQFDNDECLRKFYGSEKFQELFNRVNGFKLSKSEIRCLTTSQKPFLEYQKICNKRKVRVNQSQSEQLTNVQNRWSEIVAEMNRNLKICSFSLTNSSLLLWAHYASEHKGIAIEYDFLEVEQVRTFIQPVIYSNKVHKIDLFENYDTMQMIGSSLIKSVDWKYEQEWRLTVFKQGDIVPPDKVTVSKPIGIYLGTRFDLNEDVLKEKLFAIAKEKDIPIYKMYKHPNEFKLIESNSLG